MPHRRSGIDRQAIEGGCRRGARVWLIVALQKLLQRIEDCLSTRQITRLQILTQLVEQLRKLTLLTALTPARLVMMMVRFGSLALEVLLNGGIVLLGTGEIPALEIFRELLKGLGNRAIVL